MEPSKDFKTLQEEIQKALVATVKSANRIAAEDLSFQRTVNPEVGEQLDEKSARILALSNRLLESASRTCGGKAPKLEDSEDIDIQWRGVIDVVDSVLEKADTAIDEYTGLVKRKEPSSSETVSQAKRPKSTNKVIRHANITKPQLQFELKPDNFPKGPWKPILASKPHATVPLEESLVTAPNADGSVQYKHPYEPEILSMSYPDSVYQIAEPIPYQPVETTSATWVDTYEGVLEMLKQLKKAKEIAVDLEHHDHRTYTGLVSLMQISTREKDWIVDTLQPWRHKLEVLNEVFADPSIVKVFHGAYMDMIWLQRDLGLYVNGLFDTFFACELLYSGRSLAFLLSKFVDFDADKQYQLADWRIRPIPEEMLYYARSDTHYLLYIYDRVRNDLVAATDPTDPDKDYIRRALQRCRELSLSRHEHPGYDEATGEGSRGWYNYVLKHSHLAFDSEQFAVLRTLWKWRDDIAKVEDESPNYVLATNTIVEIARFNPPDAKALHSLIPFTAPLARRASGEIWNIIKNAKASNGPSLLHFFTSMAPDGVSMRSLPRVAKQTTRLPDLDGEVTVSRLTRSQLFGDMPISTRWEGEQQESAEQDDYIPFPWQRFVQEAAFVGDVQHATTTEEQSPEQQSLEVEAPAGNTEPAEDLDQEFTLKRGQKRKSAAVEEEEESSNSSEDESDDESDEEMADANGVISIVDGPAKRKKSKQQRKREIKERVGREEQERLREREAKKALKAEQKALKQKKKQEQQKQKYESVPFDYSKASSVLHGKRTENKAAAQDKSKSKVFDPYAKTGDDPMKGARKAPPIKGEKGGTFRK